mgnify:CR=1 FL=1
MEEEALIIGNGAAELIYALGYSLRPKRALPAATDICRI